MFLNEKQQFVLFEKEYSEHENPIQAILKEVVMNIVY